MPYYNTNWMTCQIDGLFAPQNQTRSLDVHPPLFDSRYYTPFAKLVNQISQLTHNGSCATL